MKLLASLAVVVGLGIASSAQAMPAAPAPLANDTAPITQVGWRCGPGWHINPWGRCVPSRRFHRAWGYYGAPRFYGHRHHGWHHRHWRRW